jgi:hypothetical protein
VWLTKTAGDHRSGSASRACPSRLRALHLRVSVPTPRNCAAYLLITKVAFSPPHGQSAFAYSSPPPSASSLHTLLAAYGLPSKLYKDPYYSNPADQPTRPVEVTGTQIYIPGSGIKFLPEWNLNWEDGQGSEFNAYRSLHRPRLRTRRSGDDRVASMLIPGWTYSDEPPGRAEIRRWLIENPAAPCRNRQGFARKAALRSQACPGHSWRTR